MSVPGSEDGATLDGQDRKLSRKRRFKQASVRAAARLAPAIYMAYMALVARTSRIDRTGLDRILAEHGKGHDIALAVLHQDVFITPFFLKNLGAQSVVSIGDAGSVVVSAVGHFGYVLQRGGSSSRKSRRTPVLDKMIGYALEQKGTGLITAFTVDGSTGPAGACKAGVVQFAARTGVPVYCLRAHANRGLHVRTWDRTLIPLPFSRLSLDAAGPFGIAPDGRPGDPDQTRRQVETALHELHGRSFTVHGQHPVPDLVRLEGP